MSITLKVKKQGNSFEKLLKPVMDMEKEWVQVGHFEEQGVHYSGHTYPRLMEIHHDGDDPDGDIPIPERPLIDYFFEENLDLTDPEIALIVSKWGQRPPSQQSNKIMLDELGHLLALKEWNKFGKTPPLEINPPGKKTTGGPLVLTGELRSKTAYKTSKSKTPKVVREG